MSIEYSLSVKEAQDILSQTLGFAEEKRAAAGGEMETAKKQNYQDVLGIATTAFNEATALLSRSNDPDQADSTILVALSALMASGTLESMAAHTLKSDEERNSALDQALDWLDKLNAYSDRLENINRTPHGPIVWNAEIARNIARTYERRPKVSKNNLNLAQYYYQQAIEIGQKKAIEAGRESNPLLLNASQSVLAVALGERARIKALKVMHGFENIPEEEIINDYQKSCDTIWQTLNIPNLDRVDTVLQRFYVYLCKKNLPPNNPQIQKLAGMFVELEKIEAKRNLGALVKERNESRKSQNPEHFHH